MTRDELMAVLDRLHREAGTTPANRGSVETHASTDCTDCVFCEGCARCYRSRYCAGCQDSFFLTHCRNVRASHGLSYCEECDHCGDSNYLYFSTQCFECDYCFGCVGLVRKEFHIFNQPCSRSEFFKRLAVLKKDLGLGA